jgi:hypothetical protein
MKPYQVVAGPAKFGPGQKLMLDASQIKRRRHNLIVPSSYDGKSAEVETMHPVEFKTGEVIGLPSLEKRLTGVMVSLDETKPEVKAEAKVDDKPKKTKAA